MSYLAVLFQALGFLAFAAHVVSTRNSRFEGVGILGACVFNGLVANAFKAGNVITIDTVAAVAIEFLRKAFTIQFKALGLFAIAGAASGGCRWLGGRVLLVALFRGWSWSYRLRKASRWRLLAR
jgi:hypothetical protein